VAALAKTHLIYTGLNMDFGQLQHGLLIKRYKRFLADVELDDGTVVTAHCPNTGAMTGCIDTGARVWLSTSNNPKRKLAHTLELVETERGTVCVHSALANTVIGEALQTGVIPALSDHTECRPEVRYGQGSRIDFLLSGGSAPIYVEVKAVTLLLDEQLGAFPDAVSSRAQKHIDELEQVVRDGARGALVFCVLHEGIKRVAPADHIDPAYGAALRRAVKAGIEVYAVATSVTPTSLRATGLLPVQLDLSSNLL